MRLINPISPLCPISPISPKSNLCNLWMSVKIFANAGYYRADQYD